MKPRYCHPLIGGFEPTKRRAYFTGLCVVFVFAQACKTRPQNENDNGPASSSTVTSLKTGARPVKDLAPGTDKAFSLELPRDLKVTFRFPHAIHAEGPLSAESVANFFRARVRDGNIRVGAEETRFDAVRVPAEPNRVLQIRVSNQGFNTCRVIIDDLTPPQQVFTSNDPAERMRQHGMTQDGKLLNRDQVE